MFYAKVNYLKKDINFILVCESYTDLHDLIEKLYPFEILDVYSDDDE